MNVARGFFRLWVAASFCWVAFSAFVGRESLTAVAPVNNPAKISFTEKQFGLTDEEAMAYRGPANAGLPTVADWPRRLQAAGFVVGPPLTMLLFGMVARWIARGFLRET